MKKVYSGGLIVDEKRKKPILLFDFDGVIHSYKSGWKGARNIPDFPVRGAIVFLNNLLVCNEYQICIYSARSNQWGGRRAMKKWLRKHVEDYILETNPKYIERHPLFDKPNFEIVADEWMQQIQFPTKKPPAFLTIDDRAICFDGDYNTLMDKIKNFQQWDKKEV